MNTLQRTVTNLRSIEAFVLSADLAPQPYMALLGRDVLSNFVFIYNGIDNSFSLELKA